MGQESADTHDSSKMTRPLKVVCRRIDELKLTPQNARRHNQKQIQQLAASIETFGFTVPALIDAEDNVIAGYGRIAACRKLGWSEIPTITIDGLSPARRQALMIADNRLAEKSRWNRRLLAQQLKDLTLAELDFDIPVIGFDRQEIEIKIAGIETTPRTKDADVLPISLPEMPISRHGDLWLLGEHRVLCGTVLSTQHLQTLFGEERAAMVFMKPAMPFGGIAEAEGHSASSEDQIAVGPTARAGFLSTSLVNQAAYCSDGAPLYYCIEWRYLGDLSAAALEAETELHDLCVWVKDTAAEGAVYRNQHELVFVFRKGAGSSDVTQPQLGNLARERSNVWRYPAVKPPARSAKAEDRAVYRSGTPVVMTSDAILDATATGDIVLDGCLGTGATLIAAERSRRRCFGLEYDPRYLDAAIRRWQKLTGNVARHAGTGRSFDDLAGAAEVADAA